MDTIDVVTIITTVATTTISTPPLSSTSASPFGSLTPPPSLSLHQPTPSFLLAQFIITTLFITLSFFQFLLSLLLYRPLTLHHPSIRRSIPNSLLFTCLFGFLSKLMMGVAIGMKVFENDEFDVRGEFFGLVGEGFEWFWTVGEVFLVYYLVMGYIGRRRGGDPDRRRSSASASSSSSSSSGLGLGLRPTGTTSPALELASESRTRRTGFQKTFRIYGSLWILISLVSLGVTFPWFDITTGVMNVEDGRFPNSLSPEILLRVVLYLDVLVGVMISAYLTIKTKGVWFGEGRYLSGRRRSVPKPLLIIAPLLLLRYLYQVLQLILLSFLWASEGTLPIGDADQWVIASLVVLGLIDFLIVQFGIMVVRRMVLDRMRMSDVGGGGGGGGGDVVGRMEMKPVRLQSRDGGGGGDTKWGKFDKDAVPYTI